MRHGSTPLCGWDFHYSDVRRYSWTLLYADIRCTSYNSLSLDSPNSYGRGECKNKRGGAWLTNYTFIVILDRLRPIIRGIKVLCI